MSAIVFLGPTLDRREAQAVLEADYRPPAAFGDVFRAAREGPATLGIVDGYFEGRPSIWHKEILWAMARGIHVFGAASIGALRAAELARFGMVGVGRIFEDYANGALEDDDEVAVSHGPAETGYLRLNEPMVDVRATLLQAAAQNVLDDADRQKTEAAAKSIYYKERTYEAVLRAAGELGVAPGTLTRLEEWLPTGRVEQKRLDALALLQAISAHQASGPAPKQVDYRLVQTGFWRDAQDEALKQDQTIGDVAGRTTRTVEELRLDPAIHRLAERATLGKVLALREAEREDLSSEMEGQAEFLAVLRCRLGLASGADIRRWMSDNDMADESFRTLVEDEARIAMVQRGYARSVGREMESVIVEAGLYPRLAQRARDKDQALGDLGDDAALIQACGLDDDALLDWFVGRLGRPVVGSFRAYAVALGFPSEAEFRQALAREFCYVRSRAD